MSGSWANDKRQLTVVALVAVVAVLVAAGVWQISRMGAGRHLTAYFANASALFEDNAVQMKGVAIGTIDKITPEGDKVRVDMTITDPEVKLPAELKAAVVSPSLVTGRNVTVFPAYTGGPELQDGAVIPIERTAVPLGVDDLTRSATKLSKALGPQGLNKQGVLNDSLGVLSSNLDGNGQAINDTIRNLGALGSTLSGSSDDLFGTVTELQKFVAMLKDNDSTVREFNERIADVSGVLADQREELGEALRDLATALDDVTVFIRDNRAALKSNVDRLAEVTRVLVEQRKALTETLDLAPAALSNLANTYDASTGTLNTRANLQELAQPPIYTICKLIDGQANLPVKLIDLCKQLPLANQLPTAQQLITGLQNGQLPPFPGLMPLPKESSGSAAAPAPKQATPPADDSSDDSSSGGGA
ncbi:MCE family protein [Pseudonocardia sp. CA-107938]|uniref:MCE family protein n=1 Tax=Pseudonocardia sp. CA-107938 TaxID=3240021 RepID=UPI003D90DB5E